MGDVQYNERFVLKKMPASFDRIENRAVYPVWIGHRRRGHFPVGCNEMLVTV